MFSLPPTVIFVRQQPRNMCEEALTVAYINNTLLTKAICMLHIVTSYVTRQEEVAITGFRVVKKMVNNENFPKPPAALTKLKKLLPEYRQSLANALGRDMEMVQTKNNIKTTVINLLQELADYVTATSKGNKGIMLSSGFDISEETGKKGVLAKINILEVDVDSPGQATTRVKNARGARAYIHQYTTEPPTPHTIWVSEGCGLSRYTFKGLASEKRHWFRVVAIGSGMQRAISPVVSRVIQ
ncbi:MAG TPA: hypothetical protein VGE79_05210 [Niastella sp.]